MSTHAGVIASLQAVSKRYGQDTVLDAVTLDLPRGQIVGVVGPNGSGKTTLLRILTGFVRPDGGLVRVAGQPVSLGLRCCRAVYFSGGHSLPDHVRVSRWAEVCGVAGPVRLETRRIRTLSRGQRQRAGLEVALQRPLDLVVLDEPWDALDPDGARWLSQTLATARADGAGVIVSSHRLTELAEVCDRVAVLHAGQISCLTLADRGGGAAGPLAAAYRDRCGVGE